MKLEGLSFRDRFDILLEKRASPDVAGQASKDIKCYMGNPSLMEVESDAAIYHILNHIHSSIGWQL
jgi:hypothetical protein